MADEHVRVQAPAPRVLTREQKVGYAVVVGCGVLAVVLGFFYIGKHLNGPFAIDYLGNRQLTGEEAQARAIAEQKAKDTDGDTVNDYDELNIYGSSPYLIDTDSDGTRDDIEIASGDDPACAPGASCDDRDDIGDSGDVLSGYADAAEADAAAAEARLAEITAALHGLSITEIRQLLIESGASAEQVNAMTDTEVQTLFDSVLAQLEADGDLAQLLEQVQESGAQSNSN